MYFLVDFYSNVSFIKKMKNHHVHIHFKEFNLIGIIQQYSYDNLHVQHNCYKSKYGSTIL